MTNADDGQGDHPSILKTTDEPLVATKGSHRQFTHKIKKGPVTAPGKLSADLHPGTVKSILRQAGLKD